MERNDIKEYLKIELASLNLSFNNIDKLNTEALEKLYDYITKLHENGKITPAISTGDLTKLKAKH